MTAGQTNIVEGAAALPLHGLPRVAMSGTFDLLSGIRVVDLITLEEREQALQTDADRAIPEDELDRLAGLDRAVIEARARFEAGSVKVDLYLTDGVALRIDGKPSDAASLDIVAPTEIRIGDAGRITVRPPAGSSRSIEAPTSPPPRVRSPKRSLISISVRTRLP